MRKLYSLVLIAAGLLIGTNSWAAEVTVGPSDVNDLQDYFDAGYEITLGSSITVSSQLQIKDGQTVVLDLNGNALLLSFTATDGAGILVSRGKLEIKGQGTIQNSGNIGDLIRVTGNQEGTYACDAKTQTPYAQLIVGQNVTVTNTYKSALTICEPASSTYYANGARIDVYGKLNAQKYGIKVNGSIKKPADVNNSPYVYVASSAVINSQPNTASAVAVYSSGYARWRIEGYCGGSTGLYAKSGDVEIVNAVIESTSTQSVTTTTGKTSGVAAGGSGIVIESNNAYPGETEVTITGETLVKGTTGYGIEETIDNAVEGTKVKGITIENGTISGGNKGGIIVEATTKNNDKVEIVNGTFGGTIQVEGQTTTTATVEDFMSDNTKNATHTAEVTVDGKKVTVILPGNTAQPYSVTLNANGFATFSAAEAVTIPEGLTAYKAGALENNELALPEIGGKGTEIPATTGVLLYGTPGAQYSLAVPTTPSASAITANNFKAAVAWQTSYAGQAYILHGDQLYLYTGMNMKANKAFLLFSGDPAGAPARISMRFAETEETTAVENVTSEAVKAVKFVGNDGKLYIRRGEAVYTVQGQLVK